MANDIASLVIRLSADVAKLQSDFDKANSISQRAANQMISTFKGAGDVVKEFAAGLAAAFTIDKIVEVGKAAIDLGDNLNKMSQKVGVSVEALSALRNVGQLADASFEQLGQGMVKLARTATEAAEGGKQQAAAFQAIGVSVKDASGAIRPMQSILEDVSKKFASYQDSTQKTALATQFFGKTGAELIPVLNQLGTEGFDKVTQAARDYNQVIGTEQAQQSEAFNDNLTRLGMAATGFANAVVKELLPGLVAYSNDMADAAKSNDGYASSAAAVSNSIKGLVLGFTAAKETIAALVNVVLGLGDVLGGVGDLFTAFARAVGNDLTAVGEAMRGNFSAAREAMNNAGESLASGWQSASARIRGAWAAIDSSAGTAVANTKKAYNDLFGEFSNVTTGAETTAGAVKKAAAPLVQTAEAAKTASKAHSDLANALREAAKAFERIQGLTAGYLGDIEDIKAKMSGADDAQIAYNKALRDIQDNYAKILELGPPTAEAVAAVGDASKAAAERMDWSRMADSQKKAFDQMNEQLKQSQQRWGDWADAIFDSVTKGGNFLKNLLSSVKQIVTQILKEWFRTQVIGMFAGGGGGGFGSLITAGFGALSTGGGGGGGSAASTAIDFASSASGGTQFSIMSPSSWIQAGKSLWEGFTGAGNVMPNTTMFGSWTGNGSVMQMPGGGYANLPNATGGTYAPSTFGYVAAGAAGVYAGYNRFQNSNKDVGGAIGGITYGVGTYAATIGAGAALTGGLAAGLAAVPVIGWVALALMAVDYLSGGKLFGTKGKLDHSNVALDVGAGGADLTQSYTLKGQKAFFGGTKWTTKDVAPTAEAQQAADDFYAALVKNRDQFAKAFNAKVGDLVGGTYQAQFDKKGNLTSQSTTVLGVTYKDETQEQFAQRLNAENMIAVLGTFDSKLSDLATSFRKNVDALTDFAGAAATAEAYFQAGGKMMALAADQSLSAFLKMAEGAEGMGESLQQAVQRLAQAQDQYDQFVGQFKPTTVYVDDFEGTLSNINAQMQANIKQANALARAAGAEGASVEDLTRIHEYATKQFTAALNQLQASAQSLAFNLGVSNTGSLDQVTAEIERLKAKAGDSSNAIQDFGSAISDAAQRAHEAMSLLIGDLSPLNDLKKLEVARQGLIAGTATQEEFLQIARRLFASSQRYNQEFAFAQQYPGAGGQFSSNTPGAGAAPGLTGAERDRLEKLQKEQAQLQATVQLQQFQTLAQQIAEIASAKGVDFMQVLSDMGIDIKGLEEGLGLKSDDALRAFIENIQKQKDSAGENTTILADLLKQIVVLLGGTPVGTDGTHSDRPTPGTGTPPTGHSTHGPNSGDGGPARGDLGLPGNRTMTDDDADAFGEAVVRHLDRPGPDSRRNIRGANA